jgi:DNA-binding LacI/PurR family transcriptional regulator
MGDKPPSTERSARPSTERSVRLADVAERAGVAKSIASRVLNDARVTVRPETRERVLRAARDFDYHPNLAARALNRSQTRSIGMVIPDFTNIAYARVVRGAVNRAFQREYSLLVAEDSEEEIEGIRRLVRSHLVDGLIVASVHNGHPLIPFLLEAGIPHVFALRALPGSGRNVILDDAHASRVAFDHLRALGHVHIGHVAGPRGIDSARRRAAGFRKRAKEAGLAPPIVRNAPFSEAGGAQAARELLTTSPDVTAIFTQSLRQAVGVEFAAGELGYAIPDRLSLVCYDDMPLADFLQPPLTTVRVPLEALGSASFDALSEQLEGKRPRDVIVPSSPEVIVRQSTATAP